MQTLVIQFKKNTVKNLFKFDSGFKELFLFQDTDGDYFYFSKVSLLLQ